MKIAVKTVVSMLGIMISAGAFFINSETPTDVGPIPFFVGIFILSMGLAL